MSNPSHTELAARLRETAQSIRRKPMQLADFIPLLQQAADALESPERVQGEAELAGWLYDWTHSSALGKPDEEFTSFTTDEAYARGHRNARAVYTATTSPTAPAQDGAHMDGETCLWARNGNAPCPRAAPAQDAQGVSAILDALRVGRVACEWAEKTAEVQQIAAAMEIAKSMLSATPPPQAEKQPLSEEQIEKLRDATFSINNPFCPVDSKSMRKAVRAAERAHGIITKEST